MKSATHRLQPVMEAGVANCLVRRYRAPVARMRFAVSGIRKCFLDPK
jgi:hypothetical protein